MKLEKYIDILPEVESALNEGKAVVALESTIISHGMPYPQNISTSQKCEEIIRHAGCVPAVTAIINGRIKVGVTAEELEHLASSKSIMKVSRRDFATLIATGGDGATTVAAAMIVANMAGIKVFATGGIGGVHRNYEKALDISADLQELANTDVCVVCSGVKSILDIGNTLEYLETMGVPVLGYKTDDFPAFFTRKSGFKVDHAGKDEEEIANILKIKKDLEIKGGVVVGNPVPEEFAMEESKINQAIETALQDAQKQGIHGKQSTPFLLERVVQLTGAESLETNMELVWNNCRVAAAIAVKYSQL